MFLLKRAVSVLKRAAPRNVIGHSPPNRPIDELSVHSIICAKLHARAIPWGCPDVPNKRNDQVDTKTASQELLAIRRHGHPSPLRLSNLRLAELVVRGSRNL